MDRRRFASLAVAFVVVCAVAWGSARASAQPCPAGQHSGTGMAPCKLCPLGTIAPDTGTVNCEKCPAGSYQPLPGKEECIECRIGEYAANPGASRCTDCPLGTYQDDTGADACKECEAGTYAALQGSSACTECEPGTYQGAEGQAVCVACESGRYSKAGATECSGCPPPEGSKGDCAVQICTGGEIVDLVDVKDLPDDGVACTRDTCEASGQPRHTPDHARCDDDDRCTGDSCEAQGCEHQRLLDCSSDGPAGGASVGSGGAIGGALDRDASAGSGAAGAGDVADAAAADAGAAGPAGGGCGCRIGERNRGRGAPIAFVLAIACYSMMRTPRRARSASTALRSSS